MITEEQITVAAIQPNMVEIIWPRVEAMIAMAIEHSNGELSLESMKRQIMKGEMLLLVVYEADIIVASLTLERRDFDSGLSVLNVTTAGGADLHIWMKDVLAVLEGLAEEQGCTELYIVGRPGWQRALKKIGFKPVHTVVSKKLGVK
jgi:hypothetical protein